MKPTSVSLAALACCLLPSISLPLVLAHLDDTIPLSSLSLTAAFARDIRASWRGLQFPSSGQSAHRRRSNLIKRASGAPKCVLRAVVASGSGPSNSSSHTTSSASASPSVSSHSGASSSVSGSNTATSIAASSSSKATSATAKATSAASQTTSSVTPTPTSIFKLQQAYNGSSFFDGWTFWSYGDPTHGIVDYQDSASAWSSGLVSINDAGNAIMRVDQTPVVSGNRKSIRITTTASFNGGLLVADVVHMPGSICGLWPAFWTNGPNWPNNGEIDIIEGVHASTQDLMSLHTRAGCTIASDYGATGTPSNTGPDGLNCDANATANTGCGLRSDVTNNYGTPFNNNGGGVYAMLWDDSGIRIFFFPREAIPADLGTDAPLPETWGTPAARWPASSCDPYTYMKDHVAIFDTTLCGDWAGSSGSWTGGNYAGQGQSCAAITGVSTCNAYVQQNGAAFGEAYWEVKSVKLYQ